MKLSDAIIANKTNRVGIIPKENQKKVVFEVGELISLLDSGGYELWVSQAHTEAKSFVHSMNDAARIVHMREVRS